MIAVARRPERVYVDFAHVPVSQWKIHDRLENWARACRGAPKQSGVIAAPMFALYRSTEAKREERYGNLTSVPVDHKDATFISAGVGALPDKHRRAIHWSYVHPRNPSKMAKELGVELDGLARLVSAARFKLMDMGL
jgi:DNA-directed RNA polymerase specialized sigma24 family protein